MRLSKYKYLCIPNFRPMTNCLFKIIGFVAVVAIFSIHNLQAQTNQDLLGQDSELNTITTAVPFLIISPDARAGAMGDAGVASDPDGSSIHWNPAKLAFVDDEMGFALSYTPWLRKLVPDINLAYLGFYKTLGKRKDQAIGASLLYFSLGDITFTDQTGQVIGQFRPNEFAIDVAYSRKLADRLSGGMAFRYIYSNLTGGISVGSAETRAGQSFAADISVYYENDDIRISEKKSQISWGVNISNIGTKIAYTETSEKDFIPINLRLGTALKMHLDDYNTLAVLFDINKLLVPTPPIYARDSLGNPIYDNNDNPVILSGRDPNVSVVSGMFGSFADAPGGAKEELRELTYSAGLEYWYDQKFAIRAGYFNEHYTKGNRKFFTLGAGLRYNVFGIDLAYLIPTEQRNPLENTLRFTLTFDFEAFKNQSDDSGE